MDVRNEKIYLALEREHNEKILLREINDIKDPPRGYNNQKQNYSRSNSNSRVCVSRGYGVYRTTSGNRQTEKVIITKSGKKRIFGN